MNYSKRPKLRFAAAGEFMKYVDSKYFGTSGKFKFVGYRYGLVSEKFREKDWVDKDDKIMKISIVLKAVPFDPAQSSSSFQALTEKGKFNFVLGRIILGEYPILNVTFRNECPPHEKWDKRMVQYFAEFCSDLKEIKSVQQIRADFSYSSIKKSRIQMFIDLLPSNKKIFIRTSSEVSSIVSKSEIPFELVTIRNLEFDKCTAQMFRTNTNILNITNEQQFDVSTLKLHQLAQIGPFPSNPALQHLIVNIDLLNMEFVPNPSETQRFKKFITNKEWFEKLLPSCEKTFRYLKGINPHLKVALEANEKVDVNTLTGALACYQIVDRKIWDIINLAHTIGLEITHFCINIIFDMKNTLVKEFVETMVMFCDQTGLNVSNTFDNEQTVNYLKFRETQAKIRVKLTNMC